MLYKSGTRSGIKHPTEVLIVINYSAYLELVYPSKRDSLFQHGILEILFDLFRLKIPELTEDFHTALLSVGMYLFTID